MARVGEMEQIPGRMGIEMGMEMGEKGRKGRGEEEDSGAGTFGTHNDGPWRSGTDVEPGKMGQARRLGAKPHTNRKQDST